MKKSETVLAILLVVAALFITFNLGVHKNIREYVFERKNITEETSYKNRKGVEDAARSLLTQYEFNKNEYNNYKVYIGSDDKYREQRALDSKTAANMVVSKYNNYLTENGFVFKGNLPQDIPYKLESVE